MGNTYSIGERVVVHVLWETTAGLPVDATTVIKIEKPNGFGTVSTGVTHPSTGYYELRYTTEHPGRHTYFVQATGTFVGAADGAFTVRPRETT